MHRIEIKTIIIKKTALPRDMRCLVIVSRDLSGTLAELNLHARATAAAFIKFAAGRVNDESVPNIARGK